MKAYYQKMLAHHTTEIIRLKNSREEYRFDNIALLTAEIAIFAARLGEL
jgi:uncharacterized protein YkuJ